MKESQTSGIENEQELRKSILSYLDRQGPDDKTLLSELCRVLRSPSPELVQDILYFLKEVGYVELSGIDRLSISAKITYSGRQLVRELERQDEDSEAKRPPSLSSADQVALRQATPREKWLKQLGFKWDPFLYTDGGSDPYLSEYFYKIPHFFNIFGDASKLEAVLVFGAPGSGKSSLRNAISQMCRKEGFLAVTYQGFDPLVGRSREGQGIQAQDHAAQILRAAIRTLDKEIRGEIISLTESGGANEVVRNHLWLYVSEYESDPVIKQRLENLLKPDRNVAGPLPTDCHELLGRFCRHTIELFGCKSIYFLVDPAADISISPDTTWQELESLLMNYRLIELSQDGATFKFFLSSRFADRALHIPWINQEQSKRVYFLEWPEDRLRGLLRERLRQCSERQPLYVSLGQLCETNVSEVGNLDDIVIRHSNGSPRELIAVCNRLFNEHSYPMSMSQASLLITKQEIDSVLKELAAMEKESELKILIARGESSQLEFKSTMRYDLKEGKRSKEIEKAVVRTLCAFMNTEGGILIIGVDDDGIAIGLDADFSTLGKMQDRDGFERAFHDIIREYLGHGVTQYILSGFEDYHGRRIYVARVEKSRGPIFCSFGPEHEFYIRTGNSTRKLDAKETLEYCSPT